MIENKTITLTVPVNYFCNQKCVFCIDWKKTHLSYLSKETDEKVYKMLDDWKLKFTKVVFTAWEPTMNRNLINYISKANYLWYKEIWVISNGTYFTKDLLDDLYDKWLSEITISIHWSNPIIHEKMTLLKGSFTKALKSIILIKKNYKNIVLNVSFVLNRYNLFDLYNFVNLVNKLQVNNIIINTMRPVFHWDDSIFNNLTINYTDFIKYINKLSDKEVSLINYLLNKKILRIMDIPICILKSSWLSLEWYWKLEIMVTNIDNHEIKQWDFSIDDNNRFKSYLNECNNCNYNRECEWIYNKYIEKYWKFEFKKIN